MQLYNLKNIGQRIKLLREDRRITINELCNNIGINKTSLSRIEAGNYQTKFITFKKILEYFEVSPDYLLCGDFYEVIKPKLDKLNENQRQALIELLKLMLRMKYENE